MPTAGAPAFWPAAGAMPRSGEPETLPYSPPPAGSITPYIRPPYGP